MQPNYPQPNTPNYGFIMQDQPVQKKSMLPGGSLAHKILFICLGVVIFAIFFSIIRGIVSPGTDFSGIITSTQNQQSMLSVLDGATTQQGLSEPTKEFAFIAQMAIASDQQQALAYLNQNGQKIKPKDLALKVNPKTKSDLESAAQNSVGAYEESLRSTMKSQLTSYQTDLKKAYIEFDGPKGRELLDKSYTNSELLLKKLQTN